MTSVLLIAGVIASSIGMLAYTWARAKDQIPLLADSADSLLVGVDEAGITLAGPARRDRIVSWGDLTSVSIRTTDTGPFSDDVRWELRVRGDVDVTFSNASPGIEAFLTEAPARMPGFDHEAVIQAMCSTDDATFAVWRVRDDEPAAGG